MCHEHETPWRILGTDTLSLLPWRMRVQTCAGDLFSSRLASCILYFQALPRPRTTRDAPRYKKYAVCGKDEFGIQP